MFDVNSGEAGQAHEPWEDLDTFLDASGLDTTKKIKARLTAYRETTHKIVCSAFKSYIVLGCNENIVPEMLITLSNAIESALRDIANPIFSAVYSVNNKTMEDGVYTVNSIGEDEDIVILARKYTVGLDLPKFDPWIWFPFEKVGRGYGIIPSGSEAGTGAVVYPSDFMEPENLGRITEKARKNSVMMLVERVRHYLNHA